MLGIEVVIVHDSGQVLRYLKFSLDEGSIDDELRRLVRKLRRTPSLDLLALRLEVPLHTVHPDRQYVDEAQVLRVFCEHGREYT